ncbi:ribonuclease HII [Demequina sp. TTPB684]|uniref:ribonuclease HII n=1 Tax=unclassified Demequina TaxID=2620311 RepID=UPI001CF41243|nr:MULTISPECIES: ribonuclease HII [unclassified Demequina]MCB2413161.1 ribonuclease HII [Demequina sp. TTPB684]UPU89667.1 ribonuclease HII [Demequina sp. TMPB413]
MAVTLDHETAHWDAGMRLVAGIDEVGRGALAGPVTVGVAVLERCSTWPAGLADSKELSRTARETLDAVLGHFGVGRAVGHASPGEIDAHGIVAALRLAGHRALATLEADGVVPDAILLDGTHDWLTPPAVDLFAASAPVIEGAGSLAPVTMVTKGDSLCASIAAASIIAKVERDQIMRDAHHAHPEYGWDGNKGYGAARHLDALRGLGPSPLHRVSWKLPERAATAS